MLLKINPNDFRKAFQETALITQADIRLFLKERGVQMSDNTLRWHVHHLKKANVLVRIKPGLYMLSVKPAFQPMVPESLKDIYRQVSGSFSPDLRCVLWSTDWLQEFMVLQPTQRLVVLETEKLWIRSLFEILKDTRRLVFLDPSPDMIQQYVIGQEEVFIVKQLVSRAPTQRIEQDIEVAALEKILIDLICDKELFVIYQGTELENIFLNSWKKYTLNLSVMLNYAKRRRKQVDLLKFVKQLPDKGLSKLLNA